MRFLVELDTSGDYSRTLRAAIVGGGRASTGCSKGNLATVSLFPCYAQLQWDSSIPRQAVHIERRVRD